MTICGTGVSFPDQQERNVVCSLCRIGNSLIKGKIRSCKNRVFLTEGNVCSLENMVLLTEGKFCSLENRVFLKEGIFVL